MTTSTGPSAGRASGTRSGCGQCREGERSRSSRPESGKAWLAASPASSPAPATASAVLMLYRDAIDPQRKLPKASPPWKAMAYAARARLRTQEAEVIWEAALKLDMGEIHAAPPIAMARYTSPATRTKARVKATPAKAAVEIQTS